MIKSFILGNPRSGTSLLRIMLNSHPEIIAPPECGFLQWWYEKYKNWDISDSKDKIKVDAYIDDLLTSKKIETWQLNRKALTENINRLQPRNYGELNEIVYYTWGKVNKENPRVIIDKNNYYINYLELISRVWNPAHFIFIIRDGRDVACSYREIHKLKTDSPYKPKLPYEIEDIAAEWSSNNSKIKKFLETNNFNKHIIIKYEELVLDSENILRKLADFLELDFSLNMLDYYNRNDEPISTLDWKKKTFDKPDTLNINKYKNILKGPEIKKFNSVAGKILNDFGYEI
jgi:hypothetical protein